jgi:hypothetical protein
MEEYGSLAGQSVDSRVVTALLDWLGKIGSTEK